MNLKLIHYRMHLRNTLKNATYEQLKITKEEVNRALQERNKNKQIWNTYIAFTCTAQNTNMKALSMKVNT